MQDVILKLRVRVKEVTKSCARPRASRTWRRRSRTARRWGGKKSLARLSWKGTLLCCWSFVRRRCSSSDIRAANVVSDGQALVLFVTQAWPRRFRRKADQNKTKNKTNVKDVQVKGWSRTSFWQSSNCHGPAAAAFVTVRCQQRRWSCTEKWWLSTSNNGEHLWEHLAKLPQDQWSSIVRAKCDEDTHTFDWWSCTARRRSIAKISGTDWKVITTRKSE